ncbi:hypothetical protein J2Y63_002452 [Shinella sp. BE166]|uniref:hypothetical protein n=1 Tax=Shinella sp. BE166 TaxID=3373918 RepID=UPI003EC10CF6
MRRDERVTDEMVEAACKAVVLGEDERGNPVHLSPQEARLALSAALSDQALPVRVKGLTWEPGVVDYAKPLPGMKYVACSTTPPGAWAWWLDSAPETRAVHPSEEAAKASAQQDYETRIRSALVDNSHASEAVVETWQPIETAPKDGTPIDLWGVNHLHPAKTGRRATNVTWGRIRDWMGNERDDWQHGQTEDFEPTHWMRFPAPPALSSLRPAEVGSATDTTGTGGGE